MLTAMSATLNVGQRASPMPTSMKSTTPTIERMRSIRLPTAPRAHERERERARAVSPARVARYSRPRITSAHDREHHEDPARLRPEVQPERRARIVDQREPHRVAEHLVRNPLRHQRALGDRLRDDVDDDDDERAPARTASALLRLCIFLALLALDAVARVRQRVEPLEGDVVAAVVALAERLGRAVQPAQRLVDVPEEAPSWLANRNAFSRSIASVP